MFDVLLETIRALVILVILIFLLTIGRQRGLRHQRGWTWLLVGWSLIFIGSLADITDNFESLNRFVIIGDTPYQAVLEKIIGYLVGYVFLFVGFLFWIPTNIEQVDQLKGDFVSTVSHELRTPLTSIHGSLGLLASGALGRLDEQVGEVVAIAHRNSSQLITLINDILDAEMIQSGHLSLTLRSDALYPLLAQAVESNRSYGEEFGVTFSLQDDPGDLVLLLDSNRLLQVMNNLLSNAAKFSPRDQAVEIAIERRPGWVRIEVTDMGAGVPSAFAHRLFERFSQADSGDDRRRGGSGLGLFITRQLVEAMNGRIGFTNNDPGATFWFELPLPISS